MECMNLHLAEISTQVAPGSIAALICDGAGWHQRGGEIRLPSNSHFDFRCWGGTFL
jgi:hypothetical protein